MPRTASTSSRFFRRTAVLLVVLIVLAVVLDRVGDYVAERILADKLQSAQHLPSRPDVDIDGVPFLTQLASGHYKKITVSATDVPIDKGSVSLTIADLDIVLRNVTTSRTFSTVTAGSAVATGLVSYQALGTTLGADIAYGGDGRIKATKTVTVAGHDFHGSITVAPKLVDDTLSFAGATVDGAGSLVEAAVSLLDKVFDLSVPLDKIPFGVRVKALDVDAQGLHFTLNGTDLPLNR